MGSSFVCASRPGVDLGVAEKRDVLRLAEILQSEPRAQLLRACCVFAVFVDATQASLGMGAGCVLLSAILTFSVGVGRRSIVNAFPAQEGENVKP